jgi:Domain of unknown function (DUF4190)
VTEPNDGRPAGAQPWGPPEPWPPPAQPAAGAPGVPYGPPPGPPFPPPASGGGYAPPHHAPAPAYSGPPAVGPGQPGYPRTPPPGQPPAVPPGWPAPPRRGQVARPVRVEPVPGSPFGLAYFGVTPTVSGLAVGSMVAGIGSVLVCLLVYCFGLTGAKSGWGALVAGAFAILAALVGGGAVGTGVVAVRQIRRTPDELRGRGLAVTGIVTGCCGVGLTVLGFLLVAVMSRAQ